MRENRSMPCEGFTLVELLAVVSIIALLLSILLPSLNDSRKAARRIKCQAILKNLAETNHSYSLDHKTFMYYCFNGYMEINGKQVGSPRYWACDRRILKRLGMTDKEIANIYKPGTSAQKWGAQWPWRFLCPDFIDTPDPWNHRLAYGYNCYQRYNYDQDNPRAWDPYAIKYPARKVAFCDQQGWHIKSGKHGNYKRYWNIYGEKVLVNGQFVFPPSNQRYRHDEGLNVAYFDGSVAWHPKHEMWFFLPDGISDDWQRIQEVWNPDY